MGKNNIWQNQKINPNPKETGFSLYTITTDLIDPTTGQYGTTNIQGFTLGESGLGYYQSPDDPTGYMPVHLSTGAALSDVLMTLSGCQAYLRELGTLLNWHEVGEDGPPEKVLAKLIAARSKHK
jgi:hypothetical protein